MLLHFLYLTFSRKKPTYVEEPIRKIREPELTFLIVARTLKHVLFAVKAVCS